jgi:hypothetical protein
MSETGLASVPATEPAPIPRSELDGILVAQLAVAWAGEGGEEPRLCWWRSDLTSEFGGEDLFRRLLPRTWRWATLQGAREAARRRDAEARGKDHDPDNLLSLFRLGFEVDERLDERFQELKDSGKDPPAALPSLGEVISDGWHAEKFAEWVSARGKVDAVTTPAGRRLKGDPPESLALLVQKLVAALAPLGNEYPLPHFRRRR